MRTGERGRVRIGLDLDPTQGSWAEMATVVRMADELGYDSLWTWDHLYGTDDPRQRIFEGWTTIAAWAALTTTPTVGLLVGANTFRNPGLVAKCAVTVDHISQGRCVLGLGAGWRPREHHDHGLDFGSGFGERLAWLEESVAAVSALLRGDVVTSPSGGRYAFEGLRHAPTPWDGPGRLPILIGGGGERRTIPIAARYADIWHHRGSVDYLARKLDVLIAACAAVGRDPAGIELAFDPHVIIRDDPAAALAVHERSLAAHLQTLGVPPDPTEHWFGPPDEIVERWRPYLALGFRHLIVDLPSPYDQETVTRMPEVRALAETI
jgi:alkanesulfonate monooxygenase SsuD/methylene tetrahydromethanopterin reductase-like flavin-dependent oxidoreductase (luciferase family)